jgi:hypothetical protein
MMNQSRRRYPPVKRRVTFAEDAYLYAGGIIDLDGSNPNADRELTEARWYSRQELNSFKQERRSFVRDLKQVNFDLAALSSASSSTMSYCLRGYEPYFSMEMNKATKYAREHVYSTVFAEQERQWHENPSDATGRVWYDDARMSQLVERASDWARSTALELGALDALECYAIHHPQQSHQREDEHQTRQQDRSQQNSMMSSHPSSMTRGGRPAMITQSSTRSLHSIEGDVTPTRPSRASSLAYLPPTEPNDSVMMDVDDRHPTQPSLPSPLLHQQSNVVHVQENNVDRKGRSPFMDTNPNMPLPGAYYSSAHPFEKIPDRISNVNMDVVGMNSSLHNSNDLNVGPLW